MYFYILYLKNKSMPEEGNGDQYTLQIECDLIVCDHDLTDVWGSKCTVLA